MPGCRARRTPYVATVAVRFALSAARPRCAPRGRARVREHAQLAVAQTFDQPHPVFALVARDVLPHLVAFLNGGGRKIDAWYATLDVAAVPFDDDEAAFRNINTADELAAAGAPAARTP